MKVRFLIKKFEVLSSLKNEKSKMSNNLIENYKNMLENPNFEQKYWSKTATVTYKNGHDNFRLMKGLTY